MRHHNLIYDQSETFGAHPLILHYRRSPKERPARKCAQVNTEHAQKLSPHDKLTVSYIVRCSKEVLCNCRSCFVSDSRLRASNLEVWASTFQGGKTFCSCESVGLFHR